MYSFFKQGNCPCWHTFRKHDFKKMQQWLPRMPSYVAFLRTKCPLLLPPPAPVIFPPELIALLGYTHRPTIQVRKALLKAKAATLCVFCCCTQALNNLLPRLFCPKKIKGKARVVAISLHALIPSFLGWNVKPCFGRGRELFLHRSRIERKSVASDPVPPLRLPKCHFLANVLIN